MYQLTATKSKVEFIKAVVNVVLIIEILNCRVVFPLHHNDSPIENASLTSQYLKPIINEPFTLYCPLESNPPATYWWTKYSSLDRKNLQTMPSDIFFTEDKRQWNVEWYKTHHNGLFICHAANSLGVQSYSHDTLFFLHAETYPQVIPAVIITPVSVHHNSNLTLTCEATFGDDLNLIPYWYILRNGSKQLCGPPNFFIQKPQYFKTSGIWTSTLKINDFISEDDILYCGSDYVWANYSIRFLNDKHRDIYHLGIMIIIIITTILIVIFKICGTSSEDFNTCMKNSIEPPFYGFTYDVFICAHDEIRNWVEQVILLSLENEYNPPYKICWHLRDFIAGLPINEQIVNAIYNSRKVAIIFSEHFMDSKFCQLELEHALYRQLKSKTRCLLPITLSDELVPPELKRRLTYMVLPDNKHLISKLTKLIGPSLKKKNI